MRTLIAQTAVAAMLAGVATAQDPASSWLAYVGFNTTGASPGEGRLTQGAGCRAE